MSLPLPVPNAPAVGLHSVSRWQNVIVGSPGTGDMSDTPPATHGENILCPDCGFETIHRVASTDGTVNVERLTCGRRRGHYEGAPPSTACRAGP